MAVLVDLDSVVCSGALVVVVVAAVSLVAAGAAAVVVAPGPDFFRICFAQ